MRVALEPPDWSGSLVYRIDPLRLLPDDVQPWTRHVIGVPLLDGSRVEIVSEREGTTDDGWPMRVIEARVVEGETVRELRVAALYAFFEHGGAVVVSAPDEAALESHRASISRWLSSARPVFSGEVTSLSELWDIDDGLSPTGSPRLTAPGDSRVDMEERLRQLAPANSAEARLESAQLLLELGRADEAVAQCEPSVPGALGVLGCALASLGRLDEARAAWHDAIAGDPRDVTSRYNLGQLAFNDGDFAAARAIWREAAALAPGDVLLLAKLVEAEHGLGLWDEAAATRLQLRRRWDSTTDPRVHLFPEVVIDQLAANGEHVFVYETLRPRDPSSYPVLRFVVVDGRGNDLHRGFVLESHATHATTPARASRFLLVSHRGSSEHVIRTWSELPPYPLLRASVIALLGTSQ